jgi:hypothetical protein
VLVPGVGDVVGVGVLGGGVAVGVLTGVGTTTAVGDGVGVGEEAPPTHEAARLSIAAITSVRARPRPGNNMLEMVRSCFTGSSLEVTGLAPLSALALDPKCRCCGLPHECCGGLCSPPCYQASIKWHFAATVTGIEIRRLTRSVFRRRRSQSAKLGVAISSSPLAVT